MPNSQRVSSGRVWARLLDGDTPLALWLIVLFALLLRVYQTSHHPFTSDELINIPIVDAIRLSLSNPNLVLSGPDHPLLNVYAAHISTLLLGKTLIGYRAANAVFGTLTCLAVYLLAREIGGKPAGLWAAALLAIDQFHTTLSGALNSNDAGAILFGTLALVSGTRIKPQASLKPFLGLGLWFGLAYLSKETAVLLAPALWLFFAFSPERRPVIRDPRWYLAHAVFLLVVLPDLWNLATTGGWLQSSSGKALNGDGLPIQGKALSLFFGEIVMWFKPEVLGGVKSYWCWPLRTVHWVAGVLYFAAIIWAWRRRREPAVLLVLLFLCVTFLAVSLMPGQAFWDPFWWAAMTISPAVALAGVLLGTLTRRSPRSLWLVLPLMTWLTVRTVSQQMTEYCFPGTPNRPMGTFNSLGVPALRRES